MTERNMNETNTAADEAASPLGGLTSDFAADGGSKAPAGGSFGFSPIAIESGAVAAPGGPSSQSARGGRTHTKLLVIGSGPAGLTAAIYGARANLEPVVLAGTTPGGQLMLTSDVENFPGFPEGIQGPELMAKFREQAERFGAQIHDVDVERVDLSSRP